MIKNLGSWSSVLVAHGLTPGSDIGFHRQVLSTAGVRPRECTRALRSSGARLDNTLPLDTTEVLPPLWLSGAPYRVGSEQQTRLLFATVGIKYLKTIILLNVRNHKFLTIKLQPEPQNSGPQAKLWISEWQSSHLPPKSHSSSITSRSQHGLDFHQMCLRRFHQARRSPQTNWCHHYKGSSEPWAPHHHNTSDHWQRCRQSPGKPASRRYRSMGSQLL
jgi:hypothetical protein